MAETYLHGAYGHIDASIVKKTVTSETVPVYIGTAPVGLVRGYAGKDVINNPVKITSLADAKAKVGYSQDFASYTLCEAIAAHFDNGGDGVGPIYVINVLDPASHKKSPETEKTIAMAKGRASFTSDTIVLDTLKVKDEAGSTTYNEGTDYTVDYLYNATAQTVVISKVGDTIADGNIKVTYTEMDGSTVDSADVIGMASETGEYSGIAAIRLVYQNLFVVPNLIAAPGWSQDKDVYAALVSAAQKINGHWDAMVVADLPVVDSSKQAVDTIAKATDWKAKNGFDSERSIVCWPMAVDKSDRRFHLSSLVVAASQQIDQEHKGVPFESCSNKAVPVVRQFFGDNSKNRGFDQQTANALNEHGVTTVVGWAGEWVLWGSHTAAYAFGDPTVDARAIFATSMRMLMHITNGFQAEWSPEIDGPMTRALKDRIVNREQEKLDAYVTVGALIGKPKIYFEETENPVSNLMNGDFRWDMQVTPTPPLKSATAYVSYTDEGFSAYFGGDN